MPVESSSQLAGRVVAVIGASRGIGLAITLQLAAAGARVLAGARRPAGLAQAGISEQVLDVADAASVQAFVQAAQALGADSLVHNAGIGSFGPLESVQLDEYQQVFDTNVRGLLLALRGFVPLFQQRHQRGLGSQLVTITSDVSARTFAHGGLYTASKHAQRALTQTAAHEGAAYGLRVTEVRPGMTDTYFHGRTPGSPERALHLQADDVAAAVLHALSAPAHVRVDEIVLHPVVQPVVY